MAVYRCFCQSEWQRSFVHDFNSFIFSGPPRLWWLHGRPWGPGRHDSRHTCILGRLPATWNVLRCAHSTRSNIAAKILARTIGSRWGRKKCTMSEDSVVHHPFIPPFKVFVYQVVNFLPNLQLCHPVPCLCCFTFNDSSDFTGLRKSVHVVTDGLNRSLNTCNDGKELLT